MSLFALAPYALAAYGGYKGYKASKDAGGSGLQRLLGGATGAFLGYQGGKMIPGVSAAGFGTTVPSFTQLGPIQSLGTTQFGSMLGLPQFASETADAAPVTSALTTQSQNLIASNPDNRNILQKLFMRSRKDVPGEFEIDPAKAAVGI